MWFWRGKEAEVDEAEQERSPRRTVTDTTEFTLSEAEAVRAIIQYLERRGNVIPSGAPRVTWPNYYQNMYGYTVPSLCLTVTRTEEMK